MRKWVIKIQVEQEYGCPELLDGPIVRLRIELQFSTYSNFVLI